MMNKLIIIIIIIIITTRSKTKAEGDALPPVHGVQKHLDPAVKPEHDKPVTDQNK